MGIMQIFQTAQGLFSVEVLSPIGIGIERIVRDDGTVYLSADNCYTGEQCPFCGGTNYGGGGSWSPDGCLDCNAIYHMGWVKEME